MNERITLTVSKMETLIEETEQTKDMLQMVLRKQKRCQNRSELYQGCNCAIEKLDLLKSILEALIRSSTITI